VTFSRSEFDPALRARRERALAIGGCVALVIFALVSAFAAGLAGFRVDGCGSGTCNYTILTIGGIVSVAGGFASAIAAIVLTAIRLGRGRGARWIPVFGATAIIILWWIGYGISEFGLTAGAAS
jgi:hypothetical protein